MVISLTWVFFSFSGFGQDNLLEKKVTISFENSTVQAALKELGQKAGCFFTYSNADLNQDRKITERFNQLELHEIIKKIWGENQIKLRAKGKTIGIIVLPKVKQKKVKGNLQGSLTDSNKEPLPGGTVQLLETNFGTITDGSGRFSIADVPNGTYTLKVSSVGFEKYEKTIQVDGNTTNLFISLQESINELDEVVVTSTTEAQEIAQQPIQISSIDLKPVQAQAVEVARILDDLPGVRVRQSGGFGSRTQVQLNGATGNAIRGYFDGIPFEYIANGGSINNIPVNLIDRIDVYKGVIPIDVGTDALAGGINFVTKQVYNNLLDVSYEVGSFNTHRTTFNTYLVTDSSFFIGFNGFYNYSDNNYEMDVTSFVFEEDQDGSFDRIAGTENIRVERFHDAHKSYFAEIHAGIRQKKWADDLSYRIAYLSRYDETQHGARITDQPAGDADQEESSIIQRLTYSKNGLLKGFLGITYQGTLNFLNQVTNDSTADFYNWRGQVIRNFRGSQNSSEIAANPTARDINQIATSQRLNLSFNIVPNHQLLLTNFYGSQRLEGEDPLIRGDDPNQIPAILEKNISGIAYKSKWLDERFTATLFAKYYQYTSEANDLFAENNSISQTIERGD
ncbi:MAG: carboxypeptidase-like regulatory domain-containing protein, partial [Bacteroidota bacterium]